MAELGIAVPPFAAGRRRRPTSIRRSPRTGRPAVLKTRRLGYDGKGQAVIRAGDDPVVGLAGDRRDAGDPRSLRRLRARDLGHPRARPRRRDARLRRGREPSTRPASSHDPTVPAAITPRLAAEAVAHRRADRRGARPCRRAGGRDVRRSADGDDAAPAGQRDRARASTIPATGPPTPASPRSSSSISARSPAGRSAIPTRHSRRGDDQPHRRRRRRAGATWPPSPAPACTSTARRKPARAARWAMSTGSHRPRKPDQMQRLVRRCF